MDQTALAFALAALLLTPGPTNTLMALAGAERAPLRMPPLILAEIAAYLAVTVPLALAGAVVLAAVPVVKPVLTGVAAIWVACLAYRLWRLPEVTPDSPAVSVRRVFVTTLVNPKALVVGLALLPSSHPLGPRVALFVLLIALVALLWAAIGAWLASGTRADRQPVLRRLAAGWLGLLAVGLAASAARAAVIAL